MTTLEINFPYPELTKLSTEEAPTAKTLQTLSKEVFANTRSVPSTHGGANHGFLGSTMQVADYLALTGAAWADPVHPGELQLPPVGTTAVQMQIMTAVRTTALLEHRKFLAVRSKIKA